MNEQVYISPGELRHSVQIQAQGSAVGATGGVGTTGWTVVRGTMASINTIGEKDDYQTGQFSAQVSHTIAVRWMPSPALLPGMQVLFTEQNGTLHTYLVQAVDNVKMRNVKVNLICLEIDGSQ
jgi:head-tail adaptor